MFACHTAGMRTAILVGLGLGLGLGTARANPSWSDWVGDWEGKLAWGTCLAPGHAKADSRHS